MTSAPNWSAPDPQGPPAMPSLVQPTPSAIMLGEATLSDGSARIVMQVAAANGTFAFFLDPDQAEGLSGGLAERARAARSGLTIPGSGFTLPPRPSWPPSNGETK